MYCAYHTEVTNIGGHGIKYSFMPYVMEQGAGCAQYGVNKTPDAFGHGFFDSYSIVAGHEFADSNKDGVIGRLLSPDERRALVEYLKTL